MNKDPDPLIVEVETADGTIRNILLTQGIEIRHFFEIRKAQKTEGGKPAKQEQKPKSKSKSIKVKK